MWSSISQIASQVSFVMHVLRYVISSCFFYPQRQLNNLVAMTLTNCGFHVKKLSATETWCIFVEKEHTFKYESTDTTSSIWFLINIIFKVEWSSDLWMACIFSFLFWHFDSKLTNNSLSRFIVLQKEQISPNLFD